MQPYFFPYLGYFQLINAVDTFVLYNDVNYIKQGWINRNNILVNERKQYLTIPLVGASSFKHINDIAIAADLSKIVKTLAQNYAKAPFFADVMPLLEEIFSCPSRNLSDFVCYSLKKVSGHIGIDTNFVESSSIGNDEGLRGQERLLDLCARFEAKTYINAIGGRELYSTEAFAAHGLDLFFIRMGDVSYRQFGKEFEPCLSIIDVMMFNSAEVISEMLLNYELVR